MNRNPIHPDGSPFQEPRELDGGLWLEVGLGDELILDATVRLLKMFNYKMDNIGVSLAEDAGASGVARRSIIVRNDGSSMAEQLNVLSDLSLDRVVSGKRPPTVVIDQRGMRHRVKSWADFYRTAVNALIDDQKITASDCPIKRKPHLTKCLISDSQYHPNGRRIKKLRVLHGGMFLEGDFGAIDFIRNLRVLMDHARLPHDSIKFGYGRSQPL